MPPLKLTFLSTCAGFGFATGAIAAVGWVKVAADLFS